MFIVSHGLLNVFIFKYVVMIILTSTITPSYVFCWRMPSEPLALLKHDLSIIFDLLSLLI